MAFHIGQKVVCVLAKNYFQSDAPTGLIKDNTYVVSKSHGWAVSLVGFPEGYMTAFHNCRFRPLIEKSTETGMAILRQAAADAEETHELVNGD